VAQLYISGSECRWWRLQIYDEQSNLQSHRNIPQLQSSPTISTWYRSRAKHLGTAWHTSTRCTPFFFLSYCTSFRWLGNIDSLPETYSRNFHIHYIALDVCYVCLEFECFNKYLNPKELHNLSKLSSLSYPVSQRGNILSESSRGDCRGCIWAATLSRSSSHIESRILERFRQFGPLVSSARHVLVEGWIWERKTSALNTLLMSQIT
jgi:hypothetical protein